jgi:hypothetical protein
MAVVAVAVGAVVVLVVLLRVPDRTRILATMVLLDVPVLLVLWQVLVQLAAHTSMVPLQIKERVVLVVLLVLLVLLALPMVYQAAQAVAAAQAVPLLLVMHL